MKTSNLNRKNISVHLDTHKRITEYGNITDSCDDIINAVFEYAIEKGMDRVVLNKFRESHTR